MGISLNRRIFLNDLRRALWAVAGLTLLGGRLEAATGIQEDPFVMTLKCQSLIYPEKVYHDGKDFWSDHEDRVALFLNKQFKKRGLVVGLNSTLHIDGKTVTTEKIYKNKACHDLYNEIWRSISRVNEESKMVKFLE